jgi:hypothetical protein
MGWEQKLGRESFLKTFGLQNNITVPLSVGSNFHLSLIKAFRRVPLLPFYFFFF